MQTAVVVLGIMVISQSFAYPTTFESQNYNYIERVTPPQSQVGADLCPTCINLSDQALDILLNVILQEGVVGGCGAICSAVGKKTNPAIETACNLVCDIVGVKEFADLVQKADLDPILFCEDAKVCPVFDDGDAKMTSLEVTPKSGPQGEFQISLNYESKNGTGTGQIFLEVVTVDHLPVESAFLAEAAPAGSYSQTYKLKAEENPDCDPTQGPCEEWLPGNYTVKIALCNGECGSKHPHSQIYDEGTTDFTITN